MWIEHIAEISLTLDSDISVNIGLRTYLFTTKNLNTVLFLLIYSFFISKKILYL